MYRREKMLVVYMVSCLIAHQGIRSSIRPRDERGEVSIFFSKKENGENTANALYHTLDGFPVI